MQRGTAAPLVSSLASPSLYANRPLGIEDPNFIRSAVQQYTQPTLEQQEALKEILVFDDETIIAYLTILRSIEPAFRYRAGPGCLPYQRLDALSLLKDCSDSDILTWRSLSSPASDDDRQRTLNSTISTFRSPIASKSRHLGRPSTNPSLRSSVSSLAPSAVFSSNSNYGTPRSSLGNRTSLPELPEEIAQNDEYNHEHWCTYGEHSRPIDTCDGWKRHEKEHETGYLCMPNGPVEHTQHGPICVLCDMADPSADHLAWHNTSLCVSKSTKKSRKSDMIKHMKAHRVHSQVGTKLADKWRLYSNKKCFSCGLCVAIFNSITERSNHIDNEHWKHGQNMEAWELSNSIRGLLLEPEVQAAWRALLRLYPYLVQSNLRWEMPLAKGLQLRLEKGDEPGPVLARAALQLSNYERILPNQEAVIAATHREEMMFDPVPRAPHSPVAATPQSLPNYSQPRGSLSHLPPGSPFSSNVGTSSTGFQNPQCDPPLNPSAFFEELFPHDDFRSDLSPHRGPLSDPSISDIPSHMSHNPRPMDGLSMDTSQAIDDGTRIQGDLSESVSVLHPQMSSPRHGQPTIYTNIDQQGPISGDRNDMNTFNAGRLPTSTFSHGWTAQPVNHDYGVYFRKKPLPPIPLSDIPSSANQGAVEHGPNTPMDLRIG